MERTNKEKTDTIVPQTQERLSDKKSQTLIHKQVLEPARTWATVLGLRQTRNAKMLQKFQNKLLGCTRYARNKHIYRNLGIKTVKQEIQKQAHKHQTGTSKCDNVKLYCSSISMS